MDYSGRISLIWESRSSNGRKIEGQDRGIIFCGENESLDTGGDSYKVYDLDGKLLKEVSAKEEASLQGRNTASPSLGMDNSHVMDFLDAIKTNRRPNCDVELGFKSVVAMQLGNIAWRVGRDLKLIPKTAISLVIKMRRNFGQEIMKMAETVCLSLRDCFATNGFNTLVPLF